MNARILLFASCALAVAGCKDATSKILNTAESTRSATERLAANSVAASNARQEKVMQDAGPIQRAEALQLGERYYLESGPYGWTVVDGKTEQPARLEEGKDLEGLNIDEAREALEVLQEYGDPEP